jgi:competence protein ComEC
MQTVIFYTVTLGFVFGVFVRSLVAISLPVVLLLLLIAGGFFVLWWRTKVYRASEKQSPWSLGWLLLLSLGLTTLVFGIARMDMAVDAFSEKVASVEGGKTTVTGRVIREPDVRESATLLTVATPETRVLIHVDRYSDIRYGDTITVEGKLKRPEAFVTDLGREFDYEGYLAAREITHTLSFVTPTILERDETSFLARLYQLKRFFLERLALVLPDPAYGLGAGLLLGVQSALGGELIDDFRAAGIVHIVVLSGYNIMLVVAFILTVTALFLPFRYRLFVASGAIIIFALLVGYSPSVLRATTMALILLATMLLARPYDLLRVLVLAGTAMIIANPYILRFDIGFQLSFMATLGLALLAPQFEMIFSKVTAWFSLRTFLVATIATQIAVLPLILYHIGEWSLVALPVNLVTLPMVPVAMLATFLAGIVALVSPLVAQPLALIAELSLEYIITIASFAARLSLSTLSVPAFSAYWLPVAYGLLAFLWYRWHQYQKTRIHVISEAREEELANWEIVDEATFVAGLPTRPNTKPADTIVSAGPDTPIFFR